MSQVRSITPSEHCVALRGHVVRWMISEQQTSLRAPENCVTRSALDDLSSAEIHVTRCCQVIFDADVAS